MRQSDDVSWPYEICPPGQSLAQCGPVVLGTSSPGPMGFPDSCYCSIAPLSETSTVPQNDVGKYEGRLFSSKARHKARDTTKPTSRQDCSQGNLPGHTAIPKVARRKGPHDDRTKGPSTVLWDLGVLHHARVWPGFLFRVSISTLNLNRLLYQTSLVLEAFRPTLRRRALSPSVDPQTQRPDLLQPRLWAPQTT